MAEARDMASLPSPIQEGQCSGKQEQVFGLDEKEKCTPWTKERWWAQQSGSWGQWAPPRPVHAAPWRRVRLGRAGGGGWSPWPLTQFHVRMYPWGGEKVLLRKKNSIRSLRMFRPPRPWKQWHPFPIARARGLWPGKLAHFLSVAVSSVLSWPHPLCHHPADIKKGMYVWSDGADMFSKPPGHPRLCYKSMLLVFLSWWGFQGPWDLDLKENPNSPFIGSPLLGGKDKHSLPLAVCWPGCCVETITQPPACPQCRPCWEPQGGIADSSEATNLPASGEAPALHTWESREHLSPSAHSTDGHAEAQRQGVTCLESYGTEQKSPKTAQAGRCLTQC